MTKIVKLVALALFFSAVHAQKVTRDYDRSQDFSNLKTFGWVEYEKLPILRIDEPASEDVTDEALDQLMKELVKSALEKKGFQFVGDSNPDFRVGYLLQATLKLNETTFDANTYGTPNVPYGHWRPFYNSTADNRIWRAGSITVDVVSPQDQKLMWRGTARETFKKQTQARKKLKGAVPKILKGFPPK